MRRHVAVGVGLGAIALLAASAAAFAEVAAPMSSTASAPAATPDAGAPSLVADAAAPMASDASTAPDASAEAVPDAAAGDAGAVAVAAAPAEATEAADAGYTPSDVGFSFGLRVGYSAPFGTANGAPLSSVVQGVVPIGAEMGWFLNRHLYVGGYFLYGFGVATNVANDICSNLDAQGNQETCSATMLRFGVVADWHFRPQTPIDPWVGGGLGYDIINLEAQDNEVGTLDESSALHGFLVSIEGGIDFKPLSYFGLGPYMEVATGHYSSDSSATSLHTWLTFGVRLRTNL